MEGNMMFEVFSHSPKPPEEVRGGIWRLFASAPVSVAPGRHSIVPLGCKPINPVIVFPADMDSDIIAVSRLWLPRNGGISIVLFNMRGSPLDEFSRIFGRDNITIEAGSCVAYAVRVGGDQT